MVLAIALMPFMCKADEWSRYGVIDQLRPETLRELEYPAYYNDFDKAKAQAFAGRYRRALYTLRDVKEADPLQIALIRAESLSAIGWKTAALSQLSAPGVADQPSVQIARARVLAELGRQPEAIALLDDHLKRNPNSVAGHFYLGQLCEETGNRTGARREYGWFVEGPEHFLDKWQGNVAGAFDNAEELTLIGRAIDRWAILTGAYQNNIKLHNVILNMFVRAYDVVDRSYWPAHVAAAEYLLSHDDRGEAKKELAKALRANPNSLDAIHLAAKVALEEWDFDDADECVESIRKVDPFSIDADLLEARNLLKQRRPGEAEPVIQSVLKRQPDRIEAMGLLAATYCLQLRDDQAKAILTRVEKIDPQNATAYLEVAEQLAALRQYPRSAAMYKIAIERAPWWTDARNGLGLLYTQSGDEESAHTVLEAARVLDPFNVATTNYLRLLDELGAFARKESPHFVVLYDAKMDPVIPEYFTDYLESIHADVCRIFRHEPAEKTLIEVFPTHDAFSVRTTGSPWIGTVGASTGRVIAMVAPRNGKQTMGPFNWAQVLRHEYTHTVTLSATDNRIAHWMTEGLAVNEEQSPMRWEWAPMLWQAVKHKELFSMEEITWAFVRPKRPQDRQQAYAQSWWICIYIQEKWGHDAILKMMEQFKAGKSQEQIFPNVLGCGTAEFSKGFVAWAEKQVSGWGYDKDSRKKYEELQKQGETLVKARQYAKALPIWEQMAKLQPMEALPHQRLAGLFLTKEVNQPEKAIEQLMLLDRVELKDNRFAKRLARLYRDRNQIDLAIDRAEHAVYIEPYDLDAHQLLAGLLEKSGDQRRLAREQRVIPELTQWIEQNKPR